MTQYYNTYCGVLAWQVHNTVPGAAEPRFKVKVSTAHTTEEFHAAVLQRCLGSVDRVGLEALALQLRRQQQQQQQQQQDEKDGGGGLSDETVEAFAAKGGAALGLAEDGKAAMKEALQMQSGSTGK
jgi:hypothetical protein